MDVVEDERRRCEPYWTWKHLTLPGRTAETLIYELSCCRMRDVSLSPGGIRTLSQLSSLLQNARLTTGSPGARQLVLQEHDLILLFARLITLCFDRHSSCPCVCIHLIVPKKKTPKWAQSISKRERYQPNALCLLDCCLLRVVCCHCTTPVRRKPRGTDVFVANALLQDFDLLGVVYDCGLFQLRRQRLLTAKSKAELMNEAGWRIDWDMSSCQIH
eukprot:4729084-Amphidinium_carterae.1